MTPKDQKELDNTIIKLRKFLPELTDFERLLVFEAVTEDYCADCGGDKDSPPCHSWRDE